MNEKEQIDFNFLRGKREIQRALKDSKGRKTKTKIVASTKEKFSIATYLLILLGLAIFKYIIKIGTFLNFDFVNDFLPQQLQLSEKMIEGAMTVVLLLTIAKIIKVLFINSIEDTSTRYNLNRILNLIVGIILFLIVISILFANWYTAVVSLGLISLILGFALQQPITSFIAWIYIIINRPYKVGDRIKLGDSTGDVIDIGYIETTLWESVGDSLSSEYPSGRIIKFPNSSVLNTPVYNYSWPLFPYIWDEITFSINYNSDISFTSDIMKNIYEEAMGKDFSEEVHLYHELLKETAVDETHIKEKPIVSLRVKESMWLEISIRYLVAPYEAGELKSTLTDRVLTEFKKHPEKVILVVE